MTCTLHVAWDGRLAGYDFGAGHPMAPARVELTMELARAFGVLSAPGVTVACPPPASMLELATVHLQRYIDAVQRAGIAHPRGGRARGRVRPGHRGQSVVHGHA